MNNNNALTIVLGAAVIVLIALLIFLLWKKAKLGIALKSTITVLGLAVLVVAAIVVIGECSPKRDYYDDIRIPVEEYGGEIVIKEWSYLLGSGAEIYFKKDGGKEELLGKLSGGDNGYCPFEDGKYTANVENGVLTLEWCKFSGDKDKPWETNSFELPLG